MRKLVFALVTAAAIFPHQARAADMFVLSLATAFETGGCEMRFTLDNYTGRLVQSYSATVSVHLPSGTTIESRRLRFDSVDRGSGGREIVRVRERCKDLGKVVLREVSSCVVGGLPAAGCLEGTKPELSTFSADKINFTR